MINDLLIMFKKAYTENGDKIILDYYKPKKGLYIRINSHGSREFLVIGKEPYEDELYNWFKERDYYSILLEMNKSIDPKKKVHSNNCYTMFMKKDIFPGVGKSPLSLGEFKERVEAYFGILENPDCKGDSNTIELSNQIKSEPDNNLINKNKGYILDEINSIIEEIKNYEFEGYISIFFDAPIEDYIKEYERYMIPRIFNKNSYNVKLNGEIWGLSNSNMGTNAKKPYLENKTMKCVVPYRITVEDAIMIKKFFDWLNYKKETDICLSHDYDFKGANTNIKNIRDNSSSHIIRFERSKEGELITEYEFIPHFSKKISFQLENILQITKKEKDIKFIVEDEPIADIFQLELKVSNIFFNGKMMDNYYGKIKTDLSNTLENLLIISRRAFNNFFRKDMEDSLKDVIPRIGKGVVKEHLRSSDGLSIYKAANAYNLWVSLMKYLNVGGHEMADKIGSLINQLEKKAINDNAAICSSDEEFYFASGQLAYFLLSQSEAAKLTHGVTEPFLRSNTAQELKRQLRNAYEQYNHAINLSNKRFNQIFSMVMGYDTKERMKSHEDMFLAGFMAKNTFYNPIKS